VGANAVVTKNMPNGTVAVGVNARLLNLTGDDLYVI
jgi:serine O-acetyltransferase